MYVFGYLNTYHTPTPAFSPAMKSLHYRPFAAFHSRGTKPPCWDAKVALGQDQQKAYIILNGNFLCLSCPSATFASQHGAFVSRECQAEKGISDHD